MTTWCLQRKYQFTLTLFKDKWKKYYRKPLYLSTDMTLQIKIHPNNFFYILSVCFVLFSNTNLVAKVFELSFNLFGML